MMPSGHVVAPLQDRLARRVDQSSSPDKCWPFLGATDSRGYGAIREGGTGSRILKAHRVAYEIAVGPIPEGMCVLHHCDNPPCCNPSHLFLGTLADNNRDMWAKGRGRTGYEKRSRDDAGRFS